MESVDDEDGKDYFDGGADRGVENEKKKLSLETIAVFLLLLIPLQYNSSSSSTTVPTLTPTPLPRSHWGTFKTNLLFVTCANQGKEPCFQGWCWITFR